MSGILTDDDLAMLGRDQPSARYWVRVYKALRSRCEELEKNQQHLDARIAELKVEKNGLREVLRSSMRRYEAAIRNAGAGDVDVAEDGYLKICRAVLAPTCALPQSEKEDKR